MNTTAYNIFKDLKDLKNSQYFAHDLLSVPHFAFPPKKNLPSAF